MGSGGSSGAFLELVEHVPDGGEFGGGDFFGGEGAEDEVGGGAVEGALEEVAGELLLGMFAGKGGCVDMGTEALAAFEQAFLGHDLHLLEDGGVAGLLGREGFVDLADSGGAGGPEDAEDSELCFGREWAGGSMGFFAS